MKKLHVIFMLVLAAVIASVAVYGASIFYSPSAAPTPSPTSFPSPTVSSSPTLSPTPVASPSQSTSPTVTENPSVSPTPYTQPTSAPTATPTPQNTTVVITDEFGSNVTVKLPVSRIVCLNGGNGEIICALGGESKIIAIGGTANWPASYNTKPSVGSGSGTFNTEAILSLNPDLLVVDSQIYTNNASLEIIKKAGIPVYVEDPALPNRVNAIVSNMGLVLGNVSMAEKINNNTNYYMNLIQQRIQNEAPTTFLAPMSYQWYVYGINSKIGQLMVLCGGVNVFQNNSGSISPEYAAQSNPKVLICQTPSITNNITIFQSTITDFSTRDALTQTDAVKQGRVHAFNYWLGTGIEYPAGALYFAKWLHPELFTDIDPGAVYKQLIQQYFGVTPNGVYGYP